MTLGALVALLVWLVVFYWANQRTVAFSAIVEALIFAASGAAIGLFLL